MRDDGSIPSLGLSPRAAERGATSGKSLRTTTDMSGKLLRHAESRPPPRNLELISSSHMREGQPRRDGVPHGEDEDDATPASHATGLRCEPVWHAGCTFRPALVWLEVR